MTVHNVKKGLDLPITGHPIAKIDEGRSVSSVAVVAADVVGLKPRMHCQVGDEVLRGQALFEHRKRPGLMLNAPAAGVVKAIHRGERRALQSVVIELSDAEKAGEGASIDLTAKHGTSASNLDAEAVRKLLLESGLWSALRERPFSTIPSPDAAAPQALFINACTSEPGAAPAQLLWEGREEDLAEGVLALSKLTSGPTFVCKNAGTQLNLGSAASAAKVEEFKGKHPFGLVGYHIHRLFPVNRERIVWHCNVQDAIAIGKLVKEGAFDFSRVIAFSGPQVKSPRLLRTRVGANLVELTEGELKEGENRIISGSVLGGRTAMGEEHGYLGRYHQQVTGIREGREREFFGWLAPGSNKYSILPTFISKLMPGKRFDFTTTTNGSHRAMVPIGMFEKVMPMDIMPTFLLRALAMGDVERAEKLGLLELDEEDLALSTFVCPGKEEYGPMLRAVLTTILEEG